MPYLVYKVVPGPANLVKNLEKLDDFDKFKQAKVFVKAYRVEHNITPEDDIDVKIIFAENALDAEEKLLEKRDKPILMEWEK